MTTSRGVNLTFLCLKNLQLFAFSDAFIKELLGIFYPEKGEIRQVFVCCSKVCWVEQVLEEKVKKAAYKTQCMNSSQHFILLVFDKLL